MDSASIVILITGAVAAVFLTGLGIKQIISRTPIAFYTGDEPPSEARLKSVRMWNTGHGLLWISYAVIIAVCFCLAVFATEDSLVKALLLFCGAILPALILTLGHSVLTSVCISRPGR